MFKRIKSFLDDLAMSKERQFIEALATNKLSQYQIHQGINKLKFNHIETGLIRSSGFQFEFRYGAAKQLRLLGKDAIVLHNPSAYGMTQETARLLMNVFNFQMKREWGID